MQIEATRNGWMPCNTCICLFVNECPIAYCVSWLEVIQYQTLHNLHDTIAGKDCALSFHQIMTFQTLHNLQNTDSMRDGHGSLRASKQQHKTISSSSCNTENPYLTNESVTYKQHSRQPQISDNLSRSEIVWNLLKLLKTYVTEKDSTLLGWMTSNTCVFRVVNGCPIAYWISLLEVIELQALYNLWDRNARKDCCDSLCATMISSQITTYIPNCS